MAVKEYHYGLMDGINSVLLLYNSYLIRNMKILVDFCDMVYIYQIDNIKIILCYIIRKKMMELNADRLIVRDI